jgi:lipopolysaccharide/colanic/teichoic acid biosynthesis glycosyltransferase
MRFFDLIFSLIGLVLLSPVFLIVIIILKFTGEGEIFFRQKRKGRFGNEFYILKFATMLKNSSNMGTGTITSKNDPRILPVGRVLRKTKINELPQLVNVLLGEMSLIGPRPHAERDLVGIDPDTLDKVLSLKPGLSGVGSLVFRNEEKILQKFENPRFFYDNELAPYKAQLEVWFLKNRGIKMYFVLIVATLISLFINEKKVCSIFLRGIPEAPRELRDLM